MRQPKDRQLQTRIRAFLDKKLTKYPELRNKTAITLDQSEIKQIPTTD